MARVAVRNQCARFEWIVLDWNTSAIVFYKRLGADVLPDWRNCRVDDTQLAPDKQALCFAGSRLAVHSPPNRADSHAYTMHHILLTLGPHRSLSRNL